LAAAITTIYLITVTLSRAGAGAMVLAIAIFVSTWSGRHPYMVLALGVIMVFALGGLAQVMCEKYFPDAAVGKLYNRFREQGDSSIVANDRFHTLYKACEQILENSPIQYREDDEFISANGTTAHNTLFHLALLYGWMPALAHIMMWGMGVWALLISFCRTTLFGSKIKRVNTSLMLTSGLMVLLPHGVVMMTIPAAGSFIYWFDFGLILWFFADRRPIRQCPASLALYSTGTS